MSIRGRVSSDSFCHVCFGEVAAHVIQAWEDHLALEDCDPAICHEYNNCLLMQHIHAMHKAGGTNNPSTMADEGSDDGGSNKEGNNASE